MNTNRRKKKKQEKESFLIKELNRFVEASVEECFKQVMEDMKKEFSKNGCTVSKK